MATLGNIKNKVRRLTKKYEESQITDALLEEYINTFYQYDFPQVIQPEELTVETGFYTTPYLGIYKTTDELYVDLNLNEYENIAVKTDSPVYVSGNQIKLFQSPEEFYNEYPRFSQVGSIGTGDGVTSSYTYTLPTKIIRDSVLISTTLTGDTGLTLIAKDEPIDDDSGRQSYQGNMFDAQENNIGTINYITGALEVDWGAQIPKSGADIKYEIQTMSEAQPTGVLFYNNTFRLRPVPDDVYFVKFYIIKQPDALEDDVDSPAIKQWWQYISYGAAKKILEDDSDYNTLQNIMPEFARQEELVMAKSALDRSKMRTSTIFNSSSNLQDYWRYYG